MVDPLTVKTVKTDGLVFTYDADNRLICGAKKKDGTLCGRAPSKGRNRCRFHGGETPRGVASVHFKTGKYSKELPKRLAEKYHSALADEELLALNDEIALMEARIADLISRVESGETGALWRQTRSAYEELAAAGRANNQALFAQKLQELGRLITRGQQDYKAWEEIATSVEHKRRIVESEHKRRVNLQQMMTAEQAMALIAYIISTIRKHVTDTKALAAISADIAEHVSGRAVANTYKGD